MEYYGLKDHVSIIVPSKGNFFNTYSIPEFVQNEFRKTPNEISQVGVANLTVPGLVALFSNNPRDGMQHIHIAHGTATKYQEETPSAYELHVGFHKEYDWDGCYGSIEQGIYRVHSIHQLKSIRLAIPKSEKIDMENLSYEEISNVIGALYMNGLGYLGILSAQNETNVILRNPHLALPKLLSPKDLLESLISPYNEYWKEDDTIQKYPLTAQHTAREIREASMEIAERNSTDMSTANLLRLHSLKMIALAGMGGKAHIA